MFYDMHVHTTYSADGKSTLEEYAALWNGGTGTMFHRGLGHGTCPLVPHIGFAEHVDFLPECGSYKYMDPREYIAKVRGLREKGIDFHAGAEIDYVSTVEACILKHLKEYDYEYTICSVHTIGRVSVSDRKFPPEGAGAKYLLSVAESYYKELEMGIKAALFDVVGHVGVFVRYLPDEIRNDPRMKKLRSEAEFELAGLCAKSGMIVEVNTSGLYSLCGHFLPGGDFLKNYRHFGGELVCIGSDAHRTRDIARGFGEAATALKAEGFGYITLPWDREQRIKLG